MNDAGQGDPREALATPTERLQERWPSIDQEANGNSPDWQTVTPYPKVHLPFSSKVAS